MDTDMQLQGIEDLEQWLPPPEGTLLPEEFSFPPLHDPYEQERFLRELEERAHAVKGYYASLKGAVEIARQIKRDNGGTNRLYVYASRWGVCISERTPRLKRLEGRVEVENPDFVKRGW